MRTRAEGNEGHHRSAFGQRYDSGDDASAIAIEDGDCAVRIAA